MVFLVVLCQLSRDTFLYLKHLWTMSQIVPCERLNCSSTSLSNTRWLARTVSSIAGTRSAGVEGHATATKFPTPFLQMLRRHHVRAIKCLNFTMNFSWSPFAHKNRITDRTSSCVHTHTHAPTHARVHAHTRGYCCSMTMPDRIQLMRQWIFWNDGAGKFLSTRPTARTFISSPTWKNIFVPSDSNHMMMSSMRCKHGCVVRIPPSIDRVLRNGFPA
jgi:hypothetical protein